MSMSDKVHRNKSKKHSEESKKKMSETRKARRNQESLE